MKSKYNGYSFEMRDTVTRIKVTFRNRYGITPAGDLYLPKTYEGKIAAMAQSRTEAYKSGSYVRIGGVIDSLPEDAPFFVKDYHDYHKTERGYTERSLNSNDGWTSVGQFTFARMPILRYSNEIRSAVLIMHGEKAHSCYMSRDAYADPTPTTRNCLSSPTLCIPICTIKRILFPLTKSRRFTEKI